MPNVGYVAIVGRPNTGKSTLINALIGEKVSAISPRPQTTQRSIPGIFTDEEKEIQIIFLDTPGIHQEGSEQFGSQKSTTINTRINSEAFASLRDADVILRLVDPTRSAGAEDARIDEVLSFMSKPIIRVETKQDIVNRKLGIENCEAQDSALSFRSNAEESLSNSSFEKEEISTQKVQVKGIPTGGQKGDQPILKIDSINQVGFDELIDEISKHLPEGPYLYESDYYTDQTMEFRIQEVVREQLFAQLGEEIPYACYVEVGSIENGDDMMRIQAYINVESDSQKVIVIGKGGTKIGEIGTIARLELERIFGKKVFLALRVKVDKNWRKNEKTLAKLFPKR